MIINSQAFNATGKDARRIYMKLDEFRSRRPIDVIAKTNPIVIIDEPQSVEGEKTKIRLKEFNPLMTLRYSATHRENYNMIYRLDAMEAYNKRLVKKIRVTGITQNGTSSTDSYIYFFFRHTNLALYIYKYRFLRQLTLSPRFFSFYAIFSSTAGFRRKVLSGSIYTPSSSKWGLTASLVMMILVNASPMNLNGRFSCASFSASGME